MVRLAQRRDTHTLWLLPPLGRLSSQSNCTNSFAKIPPDAWKKARFLEENGLFRPALLNRCCQCRNTACRQLSSANSPLISKRGSLLVEEGSSTSQSPDTPVSISVRAGRQRESSAAIFSQRPLVLRRWSVISHPGKSSRPRADRRAYLAHLIRMLRAAIENVRDVCYTLREVRTNPGCKTLARGGAPSGNPNRCQLVWHVDRLAAPCTDLPA